MTAPAGNRPLLVVEDLSVEFRTPRGPVAAVEHVSFTVDAGEALGIVGESGSGKTVTSLAVMGLLPRRHARVTGGRVLLDDLDLTSLSQRRLSAIRGRRIAMVFQDPMTSLNPAFTIGEQIAETVRRHLGLSRQAAGRAAEVALSRVHIPNAAERARAYPHEFSGGMRQRAALAMALSCSPELLIADEPTTALDVTIQAQILDLIHELRHDLAMSIVFITHDLGVVADLCDRVAVMYAGQVVEVGEVAALYSQPTHPYTEGLLGSARMARTTEELVIVPGQPPRLGEMPSGCRFSPRCPYGIDACCSTEVALAPTHHDRLARCIRADELHLAPTRVEGR